MRIIFFYIALLFISACGMNGRFVAKNSIPSATATPPLASEVCVGVTVNGVVGTADCSGGTPPLSSAVCSGETINGVPGTANCNGAPLTQLTFASRIDNANFPVTSAEFTAFFLAPARTVATLADELAGNATFTSNHSIIPSPLDDSDGRYGMGLSAQDLIDTGRVNDVPQKRHYLETIVNNDGTLPRSGLIVCGSTGTIAARIANCSFLNGRWAYYDGKKYGQDGEGDWSLVSVIGTGPIFEVWRDERTKLLWSDKAVTDYNWYQASGYSKGSTLSIAESGYDASPGGGQQSGNPLSVCPDVLGGSIAAGGGTYTNYDPNPGTDFKAGLMYPQVTWRLPSRNDWYLAEVNGLRKVLPNMDYNFWSASSSSNGRSVAWIFLGDVGYLKGGNRGNAVSVRCVAPSRD